VGVFVGVDVLVGVGVFVGGNVFVGVAVIVGVCVSVGMMVEVTVEIAIDMDENEGVRVKSPSFDISSNGISVSGSISLGMKRQPESIRQNRDTKIKIFFILIDSFTPHACFNFTFIDHPYPIFLYIDSFFEQS